MKKLLIIALLLIPLIGSSQFVEKTSKSDVYQEINSFRSEHGLPALQVSEKLENSSAIYAFKLHTFYSGENRHSAWANHQRFRSAELLGSSFNPVDQWKRSAEHKRILLSKGYSHVGCAKVGGSYVLRLMKVPEKG